MAFERLLRLTKKCPGYVVSGLRNASVGIATVTQESSKSRYYITRALFCAQSLFAMTVSVWVCVRVCVASLSQCVCERECVCVFFSPLCISVCVCVCVCVRECVCVCYYPL